MEFLKFTLKGRTAFFKKPDVNTYYYFTYGNIHKAALLGLFGAILGYGGYGQMVSGSKKKLEEGFPEFYDRLRNLKLCISPCTKKGYFPKKVQLFNNSVGYASKEQGGNLIVKEQWLENPEWDIYVLLDSEEAKQLSSRIMEHTCVFMPYLGKNDHSADILNPRILHGEQVSREKTVLSCLFPKPAAALTEFDDDEDEEFDGTFKYEEALPLELDSLTNQYILQNFIYTDHLVEKIKSVVYCVEQQDIVLY